MLSSQYDTAFLKKACYVECRPPDCSDEEIKIIEGFKRTFSIQVEPVLSSPPQNGYFIDSCFIHCHTILNDVAWTTFEIDGHTPVETVGDWYFERSNNTRLKDCDDGFPCNPTCP